jgi:hypothetical protein
MFYQYPRKRMYFRAYLLLKETGLIACYLVARMNDLDEVLRTAWRGTKYFRPVTKFASLFKPGRVVAKSAY